MHNFSIISSIPTSSANETTLLYNSQLIYTSHQNIYTPLHLLSLPEPVISITLSTYFFALTESFLYQINQNGRIITKLKITRRCHLVSSTDNYVILAKQNCIEIFSIPRCYKQVMYTLKNRIMVSSEPVCLFFRDNYMVVGFRDNTAIIYDIENGREQLVGSFVGKIVNVFLEGCAVVVVCSDCVVWIDTDTLFCDEDTKQGEKVYKAVDNKEHSKIIESCRNNIAETDDNKISNKISKSSINYSTMSDISHDNELNYKKVNTTHEDIFLNKEVVSLYNYNNNKLIKENENDNTNKDGNLIIDTNNKFIFNDDSSTDENDNKIFSFKRVACKLLFTNITAANYCKKKEIIYLSSENENKSEAIFIIKNKEIIKNIDLDLGRICYLYPENDKIAIRTANKICIFDVIKEVVERTIVLSDLISHSVYRNLCFLANKDTIQIFRESKFVKRFVLDTPSRIIFIHGSRNIILTVSSLGTVRLYDIQNFHCFKTFDLPFNVLSTATNEDISLIFLANESIYIYDMKRGKCIDELKGHTGPVIKLINKGNYLFSFGLDNYIRRHDIYDTKKLAIELMPDNNKNVIDFDISTHVFIMNSCEVILYDFNFNFVKAISIENKERKIIYEKICVFENKLAFIYGRCNNKQSIFIYSTEHGIKMQEIECDKVTKMSIIGKNLILQTENSFDIYGHRTISFDPIDLEINCTEEGIYKLIEEKNYLMALISATKLNIDSLVHFVINEIPEEEIKMIVESFPRKYVAQLRKHINQVERLKTVWIKNIIYCHTNDGPEMEIDDKEKKIMNLARMNLFMMESLKKRHTKF